MIQFICHPGCSTCKKARQWLDSKGISYHVRDIRLENPSAEELRLWQAKSGVPLRKFFNTSGQLYRSMGLKQRLEDMDDEELLALLDSGRKAGITLSSALLMVPQKSVSAIVGMGQTGCAMGVHNCADCSKEDCAFRL